MAIVGWSRSKTLVTRLAISVLETVMQRPRRGAAILHSARGCTHRASDYREALERNRIRQSTSREGDCWG